MKQQVITRAVAMARPLPGAAPAQAVPDPYQDRLLKLIPAEVISVYVAVFPLAANQGVAVQLIVFVLLLVGNILYKRNAGVTDWKQFLITSIAFILWVLSFGGPVKGQLEQAVAISHILIPIYTLLVPLLYR